MTPDPTDAMAAADRHAAAGDFAAAADVLRPALARHPSDAAVLHRLGMWVGRAGQLDEAVDLLRRAVALAPAEAVAHYHLGVALNARGRPADAVAAFSAAVAIDPTLAEARVNRALLRMTAGDFAAGLPEYEWRTRHGGFVGVAGCDRPVWDGSPLAGRSVLVQCEQGLGDTIQFARHLPLLKARGAGRVVFQCQPPLRRLLASTAGADVVVVIGDPPPPVDVRVPLLSLMVRLGTAVLPPVRPYLRADPPLAAAWAGRLGPADGRRRVGLVWAGSPANTNDAARSMPPAALAPLAAVPGVRYVSLQTGPAAAGVADAPPGTVDVAAGLRDFADTAAAVDGLDAVVTVDTAVAHLAGTMGKPVLLMLPYVPDWRWGWARPDTPWYPTARLFRQPMLGDWASVVAAVAAALVEPPTTARGPLAGATDR